MRHVYGYTNHSTTMVEIFLQSPSNLDVYHRIRFWIFEKVSSEMASKRTLYGYVMLKKGPFRYVCGQTINPVAMIYTF